MLLSNHLTALKNHLLKVQLKTLYLLSLQKIIRIFNLSAITHSNNISELILTEDSLKISLTAKRSELTDVQKLFLLRREIEDKIDHYVSYRVFFLCEATKDAGD